MSLGDPFQSFALSQTCARTKKIGCRVMNPVEALESRFLALCQVARDDFAARYPQHRFNVWSSSVGGRTDYQGHNLGIEALFSGTRAAQADCVALSIGIKHITSSPEISEACVTWGAGSSPEIDSDLLDEPIPLNEENLDLVESNFPKLLQVFDSAVAAYRSENPV